MKPIFKHIISILAGWIGGSIINMSLIQLGHSFYPIKGIGQNDMTALAAVMPTLEFHYFIFPFLAHSIGTFIGAFIAGLLAVKNKMAFSLSIGGLFLLAGIIVNIILPGPLWFTISDILIAYIPMAWLGGTLALRYQK